MFIKSQTVRLGLLIFLLSLTLSIFTPLAAHAESITLEEYQSWILETLTQLEGLRGHPEDQIRDELHKLAGRWEQIREVVLPDGDKVEVDHSYLVSRFRTEPADLEYLHDLVSSLNISLIAWPVSSHTSDDLTALKNILARSEFEWQTPEPSAVGMWFEEVINRVIEFFANLSAGTGVASTSILEYFLLAVGIVLFLFILISAARGIRTSFAPRAEIEKDLEQSETPVTAEDAISRARSFSEDGDYRNAVRYLYLSALIFLEEQGVLRFDLSRTNREYINDFSHRPEVVGALRRVIEVFDRVWYGYQPIDATTYAQYFDHVEHLKHVS